MNDEQLKAKDAPDGYYRANYGSWWVKIEGPKMYILQFGYDIGVSDNHILCLKRDSYELLTPLSITEAKFNEEWGDARPQIRMTKEEEFELHKQEVENARQERRQIKERAKS